MRRGTLGTAAAALAAMSVGCATAGPSPAGPLAAHAGKHGAEDTSGAAERRALPGAYHNPHVPAGPGPWFEGWYTRVSDLDGGRSLAVICAYHLPAGQAYTAGDYLPGYIQVLISRGEGLPVTSYMAFPQRTKALVGGAPVRENPDPRMPADFEWVAEGFGRITEDEVDLSIPGVIEVHIVTVNRLPWKRGSAGARPEGLAALLPLPLNWHIHSIGSEAAYRYTISSGERAGTTTGVGYAHQEKNWGIKFPRGWTWTQGITDDNQAQFVAAGGHVELGPVVLDAWFASFRSPGIEWDFRFSTPGTVLVSELDACAGTLSIEAEDGRRSLLIDASAPLVTFGAVAVPTEQGFAAGSGAESLSATVTVTAHEEGRLVDRRTFQHAALEFGAGFVCQAR